MPFRPSVNSRIVLPGGEYFFTEHPAAKGMPYGQTGRRATVYQVQNGSGIHALKVFTSAFRTHHTETSARRIAAFAGLSGLQVCSRLVLTRQNAADLLGQHPDLEYAVLMPWVQGQTWQEMLLSRQPLTPQQSLALAQNLASILATMEQNGIAHCDLSGPNVLVSGMNVALVDVEDLYAPGLEQPAKLPGGSAGYGHKTAIDGLWHADADRFAGAVLIAEMLTWCDERIRRIAVGEQYFDVGELQTGCDRYQLLLRSLKEKWSDAVANLLERAWYSQDLSDCPTLTEWYAVLLAIQQQASQTQELSAPLPSGGPVVRWRNMADEPANQPIPSTAVMALLKTAETLSAQGNIEGALVVLHQAREIASPDELAEVNEKMVKLYGKQNFSAPPVPSQSKPFATAAPVASGANSPLDDDYNAAIRLFNTKNYAEAEVIFRRLYAKKPDYMFKGGMSIHHWLAECEKKKQKKHLLRWIYVGIALLVLAVGPGLWKLIFVSPTPTPAPEVPVEVSTVAITISTAPVELSTDASLPTYTAQPTYTPFPTQTPYPTNTPLPHPTLTSYPTDTPLPPPTSAPAIAGGQRRHYTDGMTGIYIPLLGGFWMDETEVTNGMYALCANAGGCSAPKSTTQYEWLGGSYGNPVYSNYPVILITWSQAVGYCSWAGRYLPNQQQWIAAAQGNDNRRYPWGNNGVDGSRANMCDTNCTLDELKKKRDQSIDDGTLYTAPVGSYPAGAGPFGNLDMAGNVWEWIDKESPDGHYIYGGAWTSSADRITTTTYATYQNDVAWVETGFRCAANP